MDFKTLLTNRRSIRDFQNKEVPLSIIQDILQDTCLAPTARNGQPCRFIIVQNRDYIKKLSDESKRNLLKDLEKNPESSIKNYEAFLRDEQFNVYYNAPCLIYVSRARRPSFPRCGLRPHGGLFHVLRHVPGVGNLLDRIGGPYPRT